jgi:hypothetical protein
MGLIMEPETTKCSSVKCLDNYKCHMYEMRHFTGTTLTMTPYDPTDCPEKVKHGHYRLKDTR